LAADKLRGKFDRDRGKGRFETPNSSSSATPPQMDEVAKLLKLLSTRMEKIELEGKKGYMNSQNTENRGSFKRPINSPQIIERDQRNIYRDDKKIQAPLPNNLVIDEEGEGEKLEPKIHCLGDTSSFPHLTQDSYEESLMDSQLNELSKGEKTKNNPNRCSLRSKKKEGKPDVPDQPTRENKLNDNVVDRNKEKEVQKPPPVVKGLVLEVKEIMKSPPFFIFDHEIQKLRIHVPLSELVKHEDFKRSLFKLL
jgi:hypothetical protein